jgi:thiosulfate/3-mercaptopyruvate sulfurtransferase
MADQSRESRILHVWGSLCTLYDMKAPQKTVIVRGLSICGFILVLLTLPGFAIADSVVAPQLLVDASWLEDNLDTPNLRILDYSRSAVAYRLGHIPGAIRIPRHAAYDTVEGTKGMLPHPDVLAEYLGHAGVLPEHRIVIYDDSDGLWAARLFWALEVIGHEFVHILDGGFRTWKDESGPVTRRVLSAQTSLYVPTPRPHLVADTAWMFMQLENPNVQIIDSRSPDEYSGNDRRADRAGHMPGAINIDWVNNLTSGEGSSFLAAGPLQMLYSNGSVGRESMIVTHCQTGVRAAHSYFALRLLGYTDVRVYDGSWEVWGNRDDTPIVR